MVWMALTRQCSQQISPCLSGREERKASTMGYCTKYTEPAFKELYAASKER